MQPLPLVPAEPAFLPDGTLHSPLYDDIYASAAGAVDESRHVFLRGNGLPASWRGRRRFVIVETGFGAGLNFLATWTAWRETASPEARLHYLSAEKHPFRHADLARVQAAWPELAPLASAMIDAYPPLGPGFHRMHFDGGRVTLTLLFGDVLDMLRQLEARADAFYLDGFAPSKNPEMWSPDVLREVARLARPGATAATYTVAGAVREGLRSSGFTVERAPGFGRKREMLVARFAASGSVESDRKSREQAVVIGAGLAGTSCAAQLAAHGWAVQLIERHAAPAQEASGNPAGLLMPAFSLDWNPPTRLTVQSFAYARRWLADRTRAGDTPIWNSAGVLQLARDEAHAERQRRILQTWALPEDLIRLVSREEGTDFAGVPVASAGWLLPSSGWAEPAAVCCANLAAAGASVECLFNREAAQFHRVGEEWQVLDASGALLGRAPVVILANADAARSLPGCEGLPLEPLRGQLSLIPQRPGSALRIPVCREGFVTPAAHGFHCIGASYNPGSHDAQLSVEDHADNLDRLERLLPSFGIGLDPATMEGRVGFRAVSPDRLPLVGSLRWPGGDARDTGLFACLGLASRGLTWGPLLGEIIACLVTGEPLPVERDLLRYLDPRRFARRP